MRREENCLRNTKNDIDILLGQAVSKLWIKTIKITFRSITQEPLDVHKFQCHF